MAHNAAQGGDDGGRERLVELASARGVSLSALSALIGRNASYLQQFVHRGSPRKLEETDRRTLAEFLGVDEVELGGPARDTVFVTPIAAGRGAGLSQTVTKAVKWIDIPRLALGASAGPGTLPVQEIPSGTLRFSYGWLRQQGLDARALTVIEVEGDSMEPTLRDGDEILVDRTPRPLHAGVHVVRLDDVLLVKRLERGRAGSVRVISDNPAYPSTERAGAEVEVIGRVVWKGGRV